MSILLLHSSEWDWIDAPAQAGWWLIDASTDTDLEAVVSFYNALPEKPQVALLAARMSQLPRPSWTFFKPPVPSGMIFNWVQSLLHTRTADPFKERTEAPDPEHAPPVQTDAPAPVHQPWKQGLLRLKKWPNVARYGHMLELTVACSRLLAAPATYHQVLQWNVPVNALDRMLTDAHLQGVLEFDPEPASFAHASIAALDRPDVLSRHETPSAAANDAAAAEASRWGLVKRLLGKFSFR